jgi:hypothetical protein
VIGTFWLLSAACWMKCTSPQLQYVSFSAGVLTCGRHDIDQDRADFVREWLRSSINAHESGIVPDGRPWPPKSEERRLIAARKLKETLAKMTPGFAVGRIAMPFRWWCSRQDSTLGSSISIPIWMLGVLPALCAFTLWMPALKRRDRLRRHLCPTCGYPRSHLPPAAPCPECGAPFPHLAHATHGYDSHNPRAHELLVHVTLHRESGDGK